MEATQLIDFKDGFAVKNKWIADIFLSKVSPNLKDITLHLAEFSVPSIEVGSTTTAYKSIVQEIPTHTIQPTDRRITFSYMVDITWLNYFSLYQWANIIGNIEDITPTLDPLNQGNAIKNKAIKSIPINVYLINAYKQPIFKIAYDNCWIKQFSELSLSYQEDPEVIKHSFTFVYSNFRLEQIAVT
jgi:hypothetical protein